MSDSHYLQQALELAKQRKGFCAPNPAVGAVVVKNDTVLATGFHWASGHPHAEVDALAKLDEQAKDATLYVTLEPCCHWGKTPPCTELLIRSRIKRLVYGMRDPNPVVAGQGEQQLQQAGIECMLRVLPEITEFYASYRFWWRHRRPWTTVKLALSLDGKSAGMAGAPVQITGPELQYFTHTQRQYADALLTTSKTIIQDDPQLNVRRMGQAVYNKPLYVLDSRLSLPLTARVFSTTTKITVFYAKDADTSRLSQLGAQQVTCIAVDSDASGLDLQQVLSYIGADGVHDLWVETGGRCFQSLVSRRLVQRALVYVAPKCLGDNAQSAFTTTSDLFAEAKHYQWQMMGNDAVCQVEW